MSSKFRSIAMAVVVNLLIPVGLIGGTAFLVRPMLAPKKKDPEQPAQEIKAPTPERVSVEKLYPQKLRARIQSTGVATPQKKLALLPEVSGKIIWLSPDLEVGGHLKQGQVIAKLDRKDYELNLRSRRNQIAKAKLDLAIEQERAAVAKRELALLAKSNDLPATTNRALATRSHHLEVAKVAVDTAKSAVEQARVQLKRTVIRAPFDAVVISEQSEIGQVVGSNSVIATIVGSEQMHVRAALPLSMLDQLTLQGPPASRSQAKVRLQDKAQGGPQWNARADRLVHELDSQSLEAQVLFLVDDPFSLNSGRLPLLAGSLVELIIEGQNEEEVYPFPRKSLIQGHFLWAVSAEGTLRKIEVDKRWSERDRVFLQGEELYPGIQVLLNPPKRAVQGAKVEVELKTSKSTVAEASQ